MTTHNLRSGCSVILSRASMMGFASRHSATSSTLPVLPCSQLWKPVHFLKHRKFNPNISARFCICARSSSCSSFWQCSAHQTRQASLSGEESTRFHAMSAPQIATGIPAASPTPSLENCRQMASEHQINHGFLYYSPSLLPPVGSPEVR